MSLHLLYRLAILAGIALSASACGMTDLAGRGTLAPVAAQMGFGPNDSAS